MKSRTYSLRPAGTVVLVFVLFASSPAFSADVYRRAIGVRTDRPLHLQLDIRVGQLTLHPGATADTVTVTVRRFEEDGPPRIRYSRKTSRLRIRFRAGTWPGGGARRKRSPRVTIELPTGTDLVLHCKMRAGELYADLGGLRLREAELSVWAGEVEIEFGEPNPTVMSYFRLDALVGETVVRHLGNARFEEAMINGGIGELRIDFSGALLERARAEVDLDIGETRIIVPDDVGLRMSASKPWFLSDLELPSSFERRGRFYYSPGYEEAEKVLRLRLKPGMGEAKLIYR